MSQYLVPEASFGRNSDSRAISIPEQSDKCAIAPLCPYFASLRIAFSQVLGSHKNLSGGNLKWNLIVKDLHGDESVEASRTLNRPRI
jgi:hypothetical protein